MTESYSGKDKLYAFINKRTKPMFPAFFQQYEFEIAEWSVKDSLVADPIKLYEVWSGRFLRDFKQVKRHLPTPRINYKPKNWAIVVKIMAEMSKTTNANSGSGSVSYSSTASITDQEAAQDSAQDIYPQIAFEQSVELPVAVNTAVPMISGHHGDPQTVYTATCQKLFDIAYNMIKYQRKTASDVQDMKECAGVLEVNQFTSVKALLFKKAASLCLGDDWLDQSRNIKLCMSSIVNLMDEDMADYVRENIPSEEWDALNSTVNLPNGLSESNSSFIDDLLKVNEGDPVFSVNELLIKIHRGCLQLLELKQEESERGLLLKMLEKIVLSFEFWGKQDNAAENTYNRKFTELMEVLFCGTSITVDDGEKVCAATADERYGNEIRGSSSSTMALTTIANNTNNTGNTGHKIDLIVRSIRNKIDYSCNEWKTKGTSDATNTQQQAKNIKVNCCLLKCINNVLGNDNAEIFCMDWVGGFGYLYHVKMVGEVFVIKHTIDLMMPLQSEALNLFATTIKTMFSWKAHLLSMDRRVTRSRIINKNNDVLGALRPSRSSTSVSTTSSSAATVTTTITTNSSTNNNIMVSPKLVPRRI